MEKYINIQNKSDCAGCTACYSSCPRNAIAMKADEEGFLYPHVNTQSCISCGMCVRVCPLKVQNRADVNSEYIAVKHPDENTRMQSTSGGAFTLLAEYVLNKKGIIYGAAFDETFVVRHQRATDEQWKKFRGSKYVQSELGDIFRFVEKDLHDRLWVLFSGTPCQIDGLAQYLKYKKVQTETLFTCDLVCHGVPSQKLWRDYLSTITCSDHIQYINFRDKRQAGWHQSRLHIEGNHGNVLADLEQPLGAWWATFANGYSLRPSCYTCPYTNFNRVGDFTIGDFWGIENHHPEFDDNKGTSLLMINTEKARNIYQEVCKAAEVLCVKREECEQPNLQEPSQCYGERNTFWKQYQRNGLIHACKFVGLLPVTGLEKYRYFIHRKWEGLCSRAKKIVDIFLKRSNANDG